MSVSTDSRRVLVVLFIPSVERDGATAVDQDRWTTEALTMLGSTFGGGTAFPRARGVWRDGDAEGDRLVFDEPVVMHCDTTPDAIVDAQKLERLRAFCCRMGIEGKQGEVGLVIGDEYYAIRDYTEDRP